MEGHADVMRTRQFLGKLEEKERGRGGDGDAGGEDAKGEKAEREEADRREETSEDPRDAGRRRDEARPEHSSQGAAVKNGRTWRTQTRPWRDAAIPGT
ncbi:hypothetical protein NDU88_003586 [Pleurodeles waltl]|uniref:Uncharacterized protein n=1 Tax=Pleurodeles waltl TaxID=8319 RepID=A0AAV7M3T7_PLEWA|nr:hypothetical protein NDU88_003586 [Pleurodeles waltl]